MQGIGVKEVEGERSKREETSLTLREMAESSGRRLSSSSSKLTSLRFTGACTGAGAGAGAGLREGVR